MLYTSTYTEIFREEMDTFLSFLYHRKLTVAYETMDPAHSVQVWDHSHPSSRWDNQIVVLGLGLLGKEEVVRRVGIIEHLKTSSKWRNQPNWKPRSWFVNTAMHPSVGLHGEDFFFNGHSLEAKESSDQPMHSSMLVNILVTNDTLKCGASVPCTHPEPDTTCTFLISFITWTAVCFFLRKSIFTQLKKIFDKLKFWTNPSSLNNSVAFTSATYSRARESGMYYFSACSPLWYLLGTEERGVKRCLSSCWGSLITTWNGPRCSIYPSLLLLLPSTIPSSATPVVFHKALWSRLP